MKNIFLLLLIVTSLVLCIALFLKSFLMLAICEVLFLIFAIGLAMANKILS